MTARRIPFLLLFLTILGMGLLPVSAQEGEDASPSELPPLPEGAFPSLESEPEETAEDFRVFRFGVEVEEGILGITPQASILLDLAGSFSSKIQLAGRVGFSTWFPIWDDIHSLFYVPLGLELRFPPSLSAQVLYYLPIDGTWENLLFRVGGGVDKRIIHGPKTDLYLTLQLGMGVLYLNDEKGMLFPFGVKIGTRINF